MKSAFYIGSFFAFVLGFLALVAVQTHADTVSKISLSAQKVVLQSFDIEKFSEINKITGVSELEKTRNERQNAIDKLEAIISTTTNEKI